MIQEYIENISVSSLKKLISKYSANKIFLVTGKKSYKFSGAQYFIESSLENIDYVRFSEFEQNPKFEDAVKGVVLFKKFKCDMILGIGGGSVLDMAKLINVFSANSHLNLLEIVKGSKEINNKGKTLIAIPTTAGSGSEATHFAVVYHDKKKYSVAHEFILPDIVGLNSKFSSTQSEYLTACAGLDAFSQAIESYWSVGGNQESKEYAKEAIQLLLDHLERTVLSPTIESRDAVMKAAYLAGKAINISKTTAPHAVSYAFTTFFDIPHGHAVFLTLPEFLEYNYNASVKDINNFKGVEFNRNNINQLLELFGADSVNEGKEFLREMARRIGIELSLEKLKIFDYEDKISNNVNMERLGNNPRKISKEGLISLLKSKC